ncbi:MAG TPA: PilZ domain-containing protein [Candidatus Acidoferrales bacterium]|nr:PilZ domain-containing protein [Candidatus Acidoferrales bacterium]
MNLSGGSPNNAGSQYSERRTVPRFSFIAAAEIVEPVSGVHISGRISEISRKGCYVDLLNTLPTGTVIQVQISRDQGAFASSGKIIYTQEGMGMGVAFVDVPAEQLRILDSWLVELAA